MVRSNRERGGDGYGRIAIRSDLIVPVRRTKTAAATPQKSEQWSFQGCAPRCANVPISVQVHPLAVKPAAGWLGRCREELITMPVTAISTRWTRTGASGALLHNPAVVSASSVWDRGETCRWFAVLVLVIRGCVSRPRTNIREQHLAFAVHRWASRQSCMH